MNSRKKYTFVQGVLFLRMFPGRSATAVLRHVTRKKVRSKPKKNENKKKTPSSFYESPFLKEQLVDVELFVALSPCVFFTIIVAFCWIVEMRCFFAFLKTLTSLRGHVHFVQKNRWAKKSLKSYLTRCNSWGSCSFTSLTRFLIQVIVSLLVPWAIFKLPNFK